MVGAKEKVNRITSYNRRLMAAASNKKLWLRNLGTVENHPIWFLTNQYGYRSKALRLLIVAGMHGEEIAGPLGLLKWLEGFDPQLFRNVNLSFIPIINPVAYNLGKRYNHKNEKSNCGFYDSHRSGDIPSEEGIVLLKNLSLLKACSQDGFLSLHEDIGSSKFYLYTFERTDKPGRFTHAMRDKLAEFFPDSLDNELVTVDAMSNEGVMVRDGIVYRLEDGSLEHWLFTEGTNRSVTTETPGGFKLETRIEANVALIEKFIKISIELKTE